MKKCGDCIHYEEGTGVIEKAGRCLCEKSHKRSKDCILKCDRACKECEEKK